MLITSEDISEKTLAWIEAQPKEKIIEIMFEALELMSSYNGRSLRYCICTAAGFEELPDEKGWRIPPMPVKAIEPGASYWLNCAESQVHELREMALRLRDEPLSLGTQVDLLNDIVNHCKVIDQRITEHKEKAR